MEYNDARKTMAGWLRRHAHESPNRPLAGFDEMDQELPRYSGPQWKKLFIALSFWDSWIDASNHDWRYHESITAKDWPVLALEIAANLESDQEITNPAVLRDLGL